MNFDNPCRSVSLSIRRAERRRKGQTGFEIFQAFERFDEAFLGRLRARALQSLHEYLTAAIPEHVAEIGTMAFLSVVLTNLGWRWTMVIGILGHAARFAAFAYLPNPYVAIVANMLHGICYAFFFATVYIFVDEFFPKDVRSSAQGLFNVLILGIGPFAANFLCGKLKARYTEGGQVDYPAVFQYSMFAALVGAVLLLLFFHPPLKRAEDPGFSRAEEDAPPVA